jgi:polygalacturonase
MNPSSPLPPAATPWIRAAAIAFGCLIALCTLNAPLVAAESAGATWYNARAFGAVGDGKAIDSPAIDKAIEAAAAAGGGTVVLPPGTYLCGSIHLRSNIQLLIDAGASILGAPASANAYDPAEDFPGKTFQDSGHSHFHNSLIWGENLVNVTISGPGTINGGGMVRDSVKTGNKAICLKLCRNVLIHDLTIAHGGWFAILATGCDNLTIDRTTIDTDRDGMDLDCCRNCMVSNCRVNSPNDDGICPKSTYALGEIRLTENLTITGCQVSGFTEGTLLDGTMKGEGGTGRIKFGTESSGGFRNCTVANCTFRNCRGLALEEVDGGILENITITNLAMMNIADYCIYITTGGRDRTPNLTTPSRIRNILISNVVADSVSRMSGIQIMGLPEQHIDGVRLENIRLISKGGGTSADAAVIPKELGNGYPEPGKIGTLPAYGLYARHVAHLELANISLGFAAADERPAAAFDDIQGLDIDHVTAKVAPGIRAGVFPPTVRELVIRNAPCFDAPKP